MKKILTFISVMSIGIISTVYICFLYRRSLPTVALPHPTAQVTLSNGEDFKIELYPEEAPNTVNNFIYLATRKFYNNTVINRILPDYLVQVGDTLGNGYGFPGYFIKSECRYNGVDNKLKHTKGTVSMARGDKFNTEGSQFFILLTDDRGLNGQYSAFGKVIEGMESIEQLNNLAKMDGTGENLISITNITIDTFGETYEKPQVLSPITQFTKVLQIPSAKEEEDD